MRELLLLLCLASCVSPASPLAQNDSAVGADALLTRSVPAHGAVVSKALPNVMLLFSEPVRLTEFLITGTDGLSSPGMVTSAGLQTRYLVPVSVLETDTYTVSWRALKADNRVMEGTLTFTVR